MDQYTVDKLELTKVWSIVANYTETGLGKALINDVEIMTTPADIKKIQEEVDQCCCLIQSQGRIPFGGIVDIAPAIGKALKGIVLQARDFLSIAATIYGAGRVKRFLGGLEERLAELPFLAETNDLLHDFKRLGTAIDIVFDNRGEVRDDASPKLQSIRRQKKIIGNRIKDRLDSTISNPKYDKIIQENVITIRSGRFVIPIKADQKGLFPGIIHDRSASGQTVFVEPQAIVELNNSLRIAEQEEKDELHRIFKELTQLVAANEADLLCTLAALGYLDFTMAKARYGLENDCVAPILNYQGPIKLFQARHPLLKGDVVPIDIMLGTTFKTLVITGPNTGGKTVSLKTAGLLSLMAQSGLPIPAKQGSEVGVFKGIYADIGDEQSIEQSLSTFSSHLTQIVRILAKVEAGDLVLLDEIGAGTDPEEGAALAMAILDHLHNRGALTIATTHYSELKIYAYSQDGLENAAVEFDVDTLSPTFRLLIGVPGRSNAFAIAARLGLAKEIIGNARGLVREDRTGIENMISRIEKEEYDLLHQKESLQREKEVIATLKESLQKQKIEEQKETEELQADLYQKARGLIQDIKEEGGRLLKKIRSFGDPAGDRLANEFNLSLKQKEKALFDLLIPQKSKEPSDKTPLEVVKGDKVMVTSLKQKGRVIDLAVGEAQVQVGMINLWVPLTGLVAVPDDEEAGGSKKIAKLQGFKAQYVSSRLDLRGMRFEEAREKTDKYLDDAYLAGLKKVEIIHGKGTGALREGIHDLLGGHYHVKEFRLGGHGEGGSGVTIVSL